MTLQIQHGDRPPGLVSDVPHVIPTGQRKAGSPVGIAGSASLLGGLANGPTSVPPEHRDDDLEQQHT